MRVDLEEKNTEPSKLLYWRLNCAGYSEMRGFLHTLVTYLVFNRKLTNHLEGTLTSAYYLCGFDALATNALKIFP